MCTAGASTPSSNSDRCVHASSSMLVELPLLLWPVCLSISCDDNRGVLTVTFLSADFMSSIVGVFESSQISIRLRLGPLLGLKASSSSSEESTRVGDVRCWLLDRLRCAEGGGGVCCWLRDRRGGGGVGRELLDGENLTGVF